MKLKEKLETEKEIVNDDILRIKDVENTPFKMIRMENEKYKLVLANHLVAESDFDNENEVLDYLEKCKWDIATKLAMIVYEKMKGLENEK